MPLDRPLVRVCVSVPGPSLDALACTKAVFKAFTMKGLAMMSSETVYQELG